MVELNEVGEDIEKAYRLRKVYIKDFFEWIGATKSGYEWFKKKKLGDLSKLVSENKTVYYVM